MTPKGTAHICPVCETNVFTSNRDLKDGELITIGDFLYHGGKQIISLDDLIKCWACGFQSKNDRWEFIRHTKTSNDR